MKQLELAGQRFSRLIVLFCFKDIKGDVRWRCLCDCGEYKTAHGYDLKSGRIKSCGCLGIENLRRNVFKHGLSKSSEYWIYRGMLERCGNPKVKTFQYYGGRGIKVCDRWENSFENFYADMGPRPSKDHSIEREDNDGNYEPSNCRWATRIEQAANKSNRTLMSDGKTLFKDVVHLNGISYSQARRRLRRGFSPEEAVLPRDKFNLLIQEMKRNNNDRS